MCDTVALVDLGFNLQLYETSRCTGPDGAYVLIAEMARNRLGVWRVEFSGIGGHTIDGSYPTEADARRAIQLAYTYGGQTGRWHIQRRHGYEPDTNAGHASPTGMERHATLIPTPSNIE
jgi:hypothetical protein